jgi:AAA15 family ATPase/GTPase
MGKTTVLEALFQLIGATPSNLETLNKFRNHWKEETFSIDYFFHNLNPAEIKIRGFFDEEYSRNLSLKPKYGNILNSGSTIISYRNGVMGGIDMELIEIDKDIRYESHHSSFFDDIKGLTDIQAEGKPYYPKQQFECNFPSSKIFEHGNLVQTLAALINSRNEDIIVQLLQPIDERIQGIKLNGADIMIDMAGLPKLMPIQLAGDGLRRILSIVLSIYGVGKGGFVMIDEIENGLHYSTMPKLWKAILYAANEMDVQVFLTTHNEELLRSLADVAELPEYMHFQNDLRYYNLKRYNTGETNEEMVAYKYDFEKFDYLTNQGTEIR